MNQGRISITGFAKIMDISPSYLSQLMNGINKGMSYEVANKICLKLNDWSLFDLLAYPKPPEANQLPPDFKYRLENATNEVNRIFKERNLPSDTPEAEQIAIEIFERFGFKYTNTNIS